MGEGKGDSKISSLENVRQTMCQVQGVQEIMFPFKIATKFFMKEFF